MKRSSPRSALHLLTEAYIHTSEKMENSRSPLGVQLEMMRDGYQPDVDEWGKMFRSEQSHQRFALIVKLWGRLSEEGQRVARVLCTQIGVEESETPIYRGYLIEQYEQGRLVRYVTNGGDEPLAHRIVVEHEEVNPVTGRSQIIRRVEHFSYQLKEGEVINEAMVVIEIKRPKYPDPNMAAEMLGITPRQLRSRITEEGARLADCEEMQQLRKLLYGEDE